MRILCGKFLGGYEVEGTRGRGEGLMLECLNVGMLECWNVGMFECWNVRMLECSNVGMLEWRFRWFRRFRRFRLETTRTTGKNNF